MIDWVQQVLLFGTVRCEFAVFFLIHFSAYTEKDQGGWVWVGFGLGCWFITFFLFFLERMYGSLRFRVV